VFLYFNFYADKFYIKNKRLKLKKYASKKEMMLLFFVVIAISSWHQYYPVPCIRHIYWACGIMIGIFVYCIYNTLDEAKISKKSLSILLIMVLCLFFYNDTSYRIRAGVYRHRANLVTIDFGYHLNGMRVDDETYSFLYEYFAYIELLKQEFPNKQFINFTRDGFFGITFNENLTNMTVNWGNVVYYDYLNNVQALINSYKPIIISTVHIDVQGYVLINEIHYLMIYADIQTAEYLDIAKNTR